MTIEELHRELVKADHSALDVIERTLAPMYATLPKNANGKLGHATVCYALHRYFVQQHGWFIKGMSPDGSGWNGSSTTTPMQERAPAHVQDLLERHLGSRGLSLRELAALASVLHSQVGQEYLGRSDRAYRITGAPIEGRATEQQFTKAITLWMTMLIIWPDMHRVNNKQILGAESRMRRYFPHWDDLLLWVQDVRQSVAYTQRTRQNPFVGESFELEAMHQVAAEVPRRFGWWHDQLCVDMKSALLEMEGTRSTGRVSLGAFYGGKSADKDWRFIESVDYLRQLGALDESDPKRLRVIVPNYLSGPNNCIEASGVHTYCCKDECGVLVAEVERGIAAPAGAVGDIVKIVAQSSTEPHHGADEQAGLRGESPRRKGASPRSPLRPVDAPRLPERVLAPSYLGHHGTEDHRRVQEVWRQGKGHRRGAGQVHCGTYLAHGIEGERHGETVVERGGGAALLRRLQLAIFVGDWELTLPCDSCELRAACGIHVGNGWQCKIRLGDLGGSQGHILGAGEVHGVRLAWGDQRWFKITKARCWGVKRL